MVAVQQNWRVLKYALGSMKKDRDVVLAAMQENPDALAYAADVMQSDHEIVLAFVQLKRMQIV